MTVEQADAALDWLDRYETAQREANEQMKRGR